MKPFLLATLLVIPCAASAQAQCSGCDDTSAAEAPIPSVDLKGQGLVNPMHYATVEFTLHAHNTWDGDCWQPLIDQGIVMCFEEFPCTYQRELTVSYTDGPQALSNHTPHVAWAGVDCDGGIEGEQWLVGGVNFNHTLWADVLGVSCQGRCSVSFNLVCGYGTSNGPNGPMMIPLIPPHWTNWSHTFTCRECS